MGKTSKIVLVCMMLLLVVLFQLLEQDLQERTPLSAAPFGRTPAETAEPPAAERPQTPRTRSRPRPRPAPTPSTHQMYEIKSGDMLSTIAGRFYGNQSRWRLIYEANRDRIEDPGRLQPGTRIRIPRLSEEG